MNDFILRRLEGLVATAILLFFACSILFPWAEIARFFFFGLSLPLAFYYVYKRKLPSEFLSFPILAMMILVGYLVVNSFLLSDVSGYQDFRRLRWGLEIVLFLLAITIACRYWIANPCTMGRSFALTSGLAALLPVAAYVVAGDFSQRITGAGFLDHPIRGASTLLVMWAFGAIGFLLAKNRVGLRDWTLLVISGALVFLFVVLSQSRGPIGAAVLLFGLLLFSISIKTANRKSLFLWGSGLLVGLAASLWFSGAYESIVEKASDRGLSYRLEIWTAVIQHASSFWTFGVGQATSFSDTLPGKDLATSVGVTFDHTHNIFLQALLVGGVPALMLVGVIIGSLTLKLALMTQEPLEVRVGMLALVLLVVSINVTDTIRFLSSPRPDWVLFWAPLAFCAVYSAATQKTASRSGDHD
ncbi:O-antigen ligase family protein [Marinobacter arenosus]|uniref:O-antigen ligase family protein n=1 Tax=Marinobacter arenosus TaxID=2856822 RepID=UPI001C4D5EB0|nr:O-antigen ligase family protein [Marinobacter arenosus]MBW0148527.1 O-antigen ligase family protein [Marinobacter arenosus]